jgi:glycosyltransferase involved in cell wall biosynthesis
MNIVMANNYLSLIGGSERVMLDEASWLRRNGHTVTLFGRIDADQRHNIPYAELMPSLPNYASGGTFRKFEIARNVIYNRGTGIRFRSFLSSVRPDIVHCHNIYAGLTTAVVDECFKARIPCVITLHDYKLACPSYRMMRDGKPCSLCVGGKFYHCAFTRCHKSSIVVSVVSTLEAYFNECFGKYLKAACFIAPSRFLLQQMIAAGIPDSKLFHIPNGIDIGAVSEVHREGGYCLYMGRISEEKGIRTLLAAMSGSPIPLHIVGDGPSAPELMAFAAASGLENVYFDGQKSGSALAELLIGAAFLVVPSEWYENASMSVLEAMAHGKPVIASRIGGLPEQVEENVTGLLFEPGNAKQLKEAINALASNPEFLRGLGLAARHRVESLFSLDLHCTTLLKLYESVITIGQTITTPGIAESIN